MRIFCLITIVFLCFGFSDDPKTLIGKPLPSFSTLSTDSTLIDRKFFDSKITIISFYAWACQPCRYEVQTLTKLAHDYSAKDLNVLIITDDNSKNIHKHFFKDSTVSDQFVIDPSKIKIIKDQGHKLYKVFHVKPTPAMFYVDKKGIVKDYFLGFATTTKDSELMALMIKEKIEELKLE